jgi:hypothetical protein
VLESVSSIPRTRQFVNLDTNTAIVTDELQWD